MFSKMRTRLSGWSGPGAGGPVGGHRESRREGRGDERSAPEASIELGLLGGLRIRAARHLLELGLSQECPDVLEQRSRNFWAPGTLSWKIIFSQMRGGER